MTTPSKTPAARVVALSHYEVACPFCGVVVKRGAWSIAHMHVDQMYTCECGERVNVPAEERSE